MRGERTPERTLTRVTVVALVVVGLYLIGAPLVAPDVVWRPIAGFVGETRFIAVLVGFLFLYFAAMTREKDRLRQMISEILEGLNRAIYGNDTKSHREAVGMLIQGLKSPNSLVRDTALKSLRRLTAADPGADYESWRRWWSENEATFRARPAASTSGSAEAVAERSP